MPESRNSLSVPATRGVTIRDFVVFQLKLALDGVKDVLAINLSIVAIIIDLIAGRGRRPRLFYSVVRLSQRFEGWLGLHRLEGLDDPDEDPDALDVDRLLDSADDLIDQFEELGRGEGSGGRGTRDP